MRVTLAQLRTVNCEKPQPMQTKSFGNSITPELSRFLIPPRWTIISAENSTWLPNLHNRQDKTLPHVLIRMTGHSYKHSLRRV